jgi:hypothetical protein
MAALAGRLQSREIAATAAKIADFIKCPPKLGNRQWRNALSP